GSLASVSDTQVWPREHVRLASVANDRSFVNAVLDKVVRDVEMLGVADLVGREMELETYSEMHQRPDKPMLDEPPPMPGSEEEAAREEAEALADYLREDDFGPEGGGR